VAADVGTTVTGIQTAITLYALVMAAFMITGGKIGTIIGRRRAFSIGCVIYGVGSLTTSLAPNLAVLLIGWSLLEGLGAALIMPATVGLVAANVAPAGRPRAYGLIASAGAIAVAAGPLIGGLVTTYALLVIFQTLDAAGKDGTITDVMSGEPIGLPGVLVQAALRRRAGPHLPLAGEPGAARAGSHRHIQPVVLGGRARAARPRGDPRPPAGPPGTPRGDRLWHQRSEDINAFERHLDRNGTKVVKFFLHLSKEEQRRRFLSRVENPDKHWKFSPADLAEPAHWEDYMVAFEDALSATSTRWAPWYVIPADHKHVDNPRRPAIQRPEATRRG
jgi:hypothetical protein